MSNLRTKFMGIELSNPIILGASNLIRDTDTLKKAEDRGVGAVVFKSLFEEQIQLESYQLDEKLNEFNDLYYEMVTMHPHIEHAGPEEHLNKIRKARESVSIPLIASLNAVKMETWIKYAKLLSETGVDGIELNFYQIPVDFNKTAADIEDEQLSVLKEVRSNITIPVSVKLSPEYSSILNFIKKLDDAGADSFVLFNSFFQPDINVEKQKHIRTTHFSNPGEYKKALRYAGLLFGNIKADICSSNGVYRGDDVVRLLLSGATCVQVVSAVYKNGLSHIHTMKQELEDWMDGKGYKSIDEFRGKLSKNSLGNDPFIYKRAQYVDILLNTDELLNGGTKSRIAPPQGIH